MFADITMSTEAVVIVSAIVVSLAGAIVFLWRQVTANYDRMIVWKQISYEAAGKLRMAADEKLAMEGKIKPDEIVPIIPEHQSPITNLQRENAEQATVRASVVASVLDLRLPPRIPTDQ